MKQFKIRCSAIHEIMGRTGLTEKQEEQLAEWADRASGNGRPLTAKQTADYAKLLEKKETLKLPTQCISYLKQWYAENTYHDREEVDSKYTAKGNMMENTAISLTGQVLGVELSKNEEYRESEYICGTPDIILDDEILDTKCSWSGKTFLDAVGDDRLKYAYEMQMRGYMHLFEKSTSRVCYCLVNTPEECNYGDEVDYSDIPTLMRFHAKRVDRNMDIENAICKRVQECRDWLAEYDKMIMGKLGL